MKREVRTCVFSLAVVCAASVCMAAGQKVDTYDFSSPEAVFRTCGLAIKNNDPQTFYKAVVPEGYAMPYEMFLETFWGIKDGRGYGLYGLSTEKMTSIMTNAAAISAYFLEAEFVKLKEIDDRDDGKVELREYWVKWGKAKTIRQEAFYQNKQDSKWMWVPNPYGHCSEWFARDTYATPIEAYRSVGQSLFLRLEGELSRGIASAASGRLDEKGRVKMLRERLAAEKQSPALKSAVEYEWINSGFHGGDGDLEEEMFTDKDGRSLCRVWELAKDADGKLHRREGQFKLFIKEGTEWRWIPEEKSFWRLKRERHRFSTNEKTGQWKWAPEESQP